MDLGRSRAPALTRAATRARAPPLSPSPRPPLLASWSLTLAPPAHAARSRWRARAARRGRSGRGEPLTSRLSGSRPAPRTRSAGRRPFTVTDAGAPLTAGSGCTPSDIGVTCVTPVDATIRRLRRRSRRFRGDRTPSAARSSTAARATTSSTSATAGATPSGAAAAATRSARRCSTSSTSAASAWTTGRAGSVGRLRPAHGRRPPRAVPGQTWARVDRRILPDVLYLVRRYHVRSAEGYRHERPRALRRASARARRGPLARPGRHLGRRLPPRPLGRAAPEPPALPVPLGRLERRLQPRPPLGLQAAQGLRAAPAPVLVAHADARRAGRRGRCGSSRCADPRRKGSDPGQSAARARPDAPPPSSPSACSRGDKRALARAISLVENDDPEGWALVREVYPQHRPGLGGRLHGAARGGQVHADRAARGARARTRARGGGALDRPELAVHPRRAARRPHPPHRPLPRPGRLHPLDGEPRLARRPVRGDAPGRAPDGRRAARTTSSSRPSESARPRWTSSTTPTRSCSC